MPWELWIVPAIALFVWILSQFRGEETPKSTRTEMPGGERARPSSEVEKFLEEVNRMRRQTEQQRRPETRPQPVPEAIPVALPVDPPYAEPVRQVAAPARPPKPKQRPRPTAVARAAEPVRAVPPPAAAPVGSVQPAILIPSAEPLQLKGFSPAVGQLWSLLRTPQSMQTAVLLHEVLGPPRSRRRR